MSPSITAQLFSFCQGKGASLALLAAWKKSVVHRENSFSLPAFHVLPCLYLSRDKVQKKVWLLLREPYQPVEKGSERS
jgi:hypothetical protein